jgi:hypothetical protein
MCRIQGAYEAGCTGEIKLTGGRMYRGTDKQEARCTGAHVCTDIQGAEVHGRQNVQVSVCTGGIIRYRRQDVQEASV